MIEKLWETLNSKEWQIYPPVNPELTQKRIIASRDSALRLFTPWGPPYNKEALDLREGSEIKTLKKLAEIARLFASYEIDVQWVILGADLYGTEINRLGRLDGPPRISEEVVKRYFSNLNRALLVRLPQAKLYLWSQIRFEHQTAYSRYQEDYNTERIGQLIGETLLKQMTYTAKLICRLSSKEEAEIMALRYLKERISEALLVEEIWQPIKISLAPPGKDEIVDMNLPRLYLIPKELQTPWLAKS